MSKDLLIQTCNNLLKTKGLDQDPRFKKRLKWELEEIIAKDKSAYFWDFYTRKVRYPKNQNNLMVCWLLGIVPDYDIDQDPNCEYGEFPDIDIDYLPIVRAYMKKSWAAQTFGEPYVCNIGSYSTYGIKSAINDMVRVHGEGREEVQALTKDLQAKDDEGKPLSWDAAMKLYPELKKWCDDHPDVTKATKKLLNRIRSLGTHAAGLIISSVPLSDFVPIVRLKENPQASAWVEGLSGQDLQPVGLVKFDLLVIENLLQIARCCELVKRRYNLEGVCNLPGMPDWSDVPKWRNDPKALAMAAAGDLKGIFQFDKETVRNMARTGGVDRFEDLVAYTSLNRPGCLLSKMHERYIERKRGREKFELHPLIKPILEKTYGVMVFQEQTMKILNIVGEIPLKDCEAVRKAISKKKIEGILKYKQMFLDNGQKNLGWTLKQMEDFWAQIESWSEYGFNLSHAVSYTYISQWLLYLKAHYPYEFYNSILSCEKESEKIKEYKMEAKIHGVEVHRLDINKSAVNFELQGDVVYYGFSNVKGIGETPAAKIVEHQPYNGFEDFLYRFGTNASVLKPLLGLRCFRERDPVTLWKFAEHYKEAVKKIDDRRKRNAKSLEKYEEELQQLIPGFDKKLSDFSISSNPFDTPEFKEKYDLDEPSEHQKEVPCNEDDPTGTPRTEVQYLEVDENTEIEQEVTVYYKLITVKKVWNRWKALKDLWNKRKRSIDKFQNGEKSVLPKLAEFDPSKHAIAEDLGKELSDPVLCEEKYYGFAWIHELERSPDYRGNMTFDDLKNSEAPSNPVELRVKKVVKATSKKGSTYYQVFAEDVTGQENRVFVWQDDWAWWEKEFSKDNLLRVRLQPPSGGFNSYLIESNQVGKWRNQKRYNSKEDDVRVVVMRPGEREEDKFLTDEEALEQFTNCTM